MLSREELYRKAQRHLSRRDPVLRRLIRATGPCTLRHNPNGFAVLVSSIISQQISTKAAMAIRTRLENSLRPGKITPAKLRSAPPAVYRVAGLSAVKERALRDLAQKASTIPLRALPGLPDDEVVERLIPIFGIGRWTAQMFLIFSLGRHDVLPVADFGLRAGVQKQYGLATLPKAAELEELAEPWRPYRSIATWYLWRSLGNVPQSDKPNGKA
jgi:DNA-3-methyladenine glycosylase II